MNLIKRMKIVFFIMVFSIAGCASLPKSPLFENQLRDIKTPEISTIRESSSKMAYPASFKETWEGTLAILTKYAIIATVSKVSEKAVIITYIDIDGFYYKKQEGTSAVKIFTAELPFTALIEEKQHNKTDIYVLPRMELLDKADVFPIPRTNTDMNTPKDEKIHGNGIPDEMMKVLRTASLEKANQLLERILTQLSANKSWRWLVE